MMSADKVGPAKIATALSKPEVPSLSLKGRRPTPSSESTQGLQTIHEKAYAMTKKEIRGLRASKPRGGEADCRTEALPTLILIILPVASTL
jgi:hypothetical protein